MLLQSEKRLGPKTIPICHVHCIRRTFSSGIFKQSINIQNQNAKTIMIRIIYKIKPIPIGMVLSGPK
jgi:hypothetical protein